MKSIFTYIILSILLGMTNAQQLVCHTDELDMPGLVNKIAYLPILDRIHPGTTEAKQGSVILFKNDGTTLPDRLLLFPNNTILCMYTRNGESVWALVTVASKFWERQIFSHVPADLPYKYLNCPDFGTADIEALAGLLSHLEGMYCPLPPGTSELITYKPEKESFTQDDLYRKFLESQIEQMNEERKARYNNQPSEWIMKEVIFNDKTYIVDPKDGFVYFEAVFFSEGFKCKNQREVIQKKGINFFISTGDPTMDSHSNSQLGFYIPFPYLGEHRVGDIYIPNPPVELSAEVKLFYGIEEIDPTSADGELPDDKLPPGVSLPEGEVEGLLTCPDELMTDPAWGVQSENWKSNTYLIDMADAQGLNDWILLTSNQCFKCMDRGNSFLAEAYSPRHNLSLQILETLPFEALNSQESSPEKTKTLKTLEHAFTRALQGRILDNRITFLGEEGFIYQDHQHQWTLALQDQELVYHADQPLNVAALNAWMKKYAKKPIRFDTPPSDDLVRQIFTYGAKGKVHWAKLFYRNPLTFIEKNCSINRQSNEN